MPDPSDERKTIEGAINDPVAFIGVLALTAINATVVSALSFFQAKLDTQLWINVMIGMAVFTLVVALILVWVRKKTYSKEKAYGFARRSFCHANYRPSVRPVVDHLAFQSDDRSGGEHNSTKKRL